MVQWSEQSFLAEVIVVRKGRMRRVDRLGDDHSWRQSIVKILQCAAIITLDTKRLQVPKLLQYRIHSFIRLWLHFLWVDLQCICHEDIHSGGALVETMSWAIQDVWKWQLGHYLLALLHHWQSSISGLNQLACQFAGPSWKSTRFRGANWSYIALQKAIGW